MLDWIGWVGVAAGFCIGPSQLVKLLRSRNVGGISVATYVFLVVALGAYLVHAVAIGDAVFIVSNGVALVVNGTILVLLLRWRGA